jgi:hypothetical protein
VLASTFFSRYSCPVLFRFTQTESPTTVPNKKTRAASPPHYGESALPQRRLSQTLDLANHDQPSSKILTLAIAAQYTGYDLSPSVDGRQYYSSSSSSTTAVDAGQVAAYHPLSYPEQDDSGYTDQQQQPQQPPNDASSSASVGTYNSIGVDGSSATAISSSGVTFFHGGTLALPLPFPHPHPYSQSHSHSHSQPYTYPNPSPPPPPPSSSLQPSASPLAAKASAQAQARQHQSTPATLPKEKQPSSRAARMTTAAAAAADPSPRPARRVRTGCLTCRERHLKCDEATPDCNNCRKSNRVCVRGVKLNFIDIKAETPPILLVSRVEDAQFVDESRAIASEYVGGAGRYAVVRPERLTLLDSRENRLQQQAQQSQHQQQQNHYPPHPQYDQGTQQEQAHHQLSDPALRTGSFQRPSRSAEHGHLRGHSAESIGTIASMDRGPQYPAEQSYVPPPDGIQLMTNRDEMFYMQIFVEEVACWMDSMDADKHFSRQLPHQALTEPMLLHACLACGAKHMTLIDPQRHPEDIAQQYYNSATNAVLRLVQSTHRDLQACATTAVVLNVYELMSEKAMQRMNQIAGARQLILRCGWNGRSKGVAGACFWLNIGLEVLSCMHFNRKIAWDPDEWGLDFSFEAPSGPGNEEIWTYRMLYLTAKIVNFRADLSTHTVPIDWTSYEQWKRLKEMCEAWNQATPPTMQALGDIPPHLTFSKSCFPEIWIIKRNAVIARLFYHTALCLLASINPNQSEFESMQALKLYHAHQICGITAHVKDRGVSSVALRSLAVAAEALTVRREQEEVFQMFNRIKRETGWRMTYIYNELPGKWGWDPATQSANVHAHNLSLQSPSNSIPSSQAPVLTSPSILHHQNSVTQNGSPSHSLSSTLPLPQPLLNPQHHHQPTTLSPHQYQQHQPSASSSVMQPHHGYSTSMPMSMVDAQSQHGQPISYGPSHGHAHSHSHSQGHISHPPPPPPSSSMSQEYPLSSIQSSQAPYYSHPN